MHPDPPALPGDLYCERCGWLFAAEMLQGQDPLTLEDVLRCPSHRRLSRAK
jgi:hypothetical protein